MQDEDHCTIDGVVYAPVGDPSVGGSCKGCAGEYGVPGSGGLCHQLPACTREARQDSRDVIWVRAE